MEKIKDWIKKRWPVLVLIILIIVVVIALNQYLKYRKPPIEVKSSYKPNTPYFTPDQEVEEEKQEPIAQMIDTYVSYCNNKEYEKAYNMLSKECKEIVFKSFEDYKEYIDLLFNEKKIHNIQNMANIDGKYSYRVRLLEDILASGLTGKEDLWFQEDIFTIVMDENGEHKLNIRKFIGKEQLDRVYESEYMKLKVDNRIIQYDAEVYQLTITNRSEFMIVIQDYTENKEICIKVGNEYIKAVRDDKKVIIEPGKTRTFTLTFEKTYALSKTTTEMDFNAIRILKTYSGLPAKRQEELDNAEKLYGLELKF